MPKLYKRVSFNRFPMCFLGIVALLCTSSPLTLLRSEQHLSAQSGAFFRQQCPSLWDAVGRRFTVPTGNSRIPGAAEVEIAEFGNDGVPAESLTCISDKLTAIHSMRGPLDDNPHGIALPHFQTPAGQIGTVEYGLWASSSNGGEADAYSMLFTRDNRAVVVTFYGYNFWVTEQLDLTAHAIWQNLASLPPNSQTASNQMANAGLWPLVTVTTTIPPIETEDYLDTLAAGLNDGWQPRTPAIDAGMSVVAPQLLRSPTIPPTLPSAGLPVVAAT